MTALPSLITVKALQSRLLLPLIAAPMFLVSGPDLVITACQNGVIGSFPTANCRSLPELDQWLGRMALETQGFAPYCPNLIVHRSNPRLADDLALVIQHRAQIVIASVGSPEHVVGPLHAAGCLVLADVASLRHAQKAIAAGVDGLVLLSAGAGGQTGWANPFAFVRAVRQIYDGIIVLAGGISDGVALKAAMALGCDMAYMGTKFIATQESMAASAYKQMLVGSQLDDVLLTKAFTGLQTNMLTPSIVAAGLDPANLPVRGHIDISKDINAAERDKPEAKRWKDIWSAGHSVSGVTDVPTVAELVARTRVEYAGAARLGA